MKPSSELTFFAVHSMRVLAPDGSEFELIKKDTETENGSSINNDVDIPTKSVSKNSIRYDGTKSQEKLSDRSPESTSTRSLLANALESIVSTLVVSKLPQWK